MCCEMNFSVVPLNKKSCAIRTVLDFESLLFEFPTTTQTCINGFAGHQKTTVNPTLTAVPRMVLRW